VALVWGTNWAVTKLAAGDFAPLFMAGVRSLVASACLAVYMKIKGIPFFPSLGLTFHGLVVGLLFGAEFALIYIALAHYSLASHVYVLVYTAPIFAAMGAHFFLEGDRLSRSKAAGLVVAFFGVVVLFLKDMTSFSIQTLAGDLMLVGAGAVWGATTIWIKRFMVHRSGPIQNLFYNVLFSVPLLLVLSFIFEDAPIKGLTGFGLFPST
jgi:drug/metabolite transporter (DMT)-like permease